MGTTSNLPKRGTLKTKKEADKNGIIIVYLSAAYMFMLTYTQWTIYWNCLMYERYTTMVQ